MIDHLIELFLYVLFGTTFALIIIRVLSEMEKDKD